MIDLTPLARLSVWAIAITAAAAGLVAASLFVDVPIWWIAPAAVATYMALRLTLFKD